MTGTRKLEPTPLEKFGSTGAFGPLNIGSEKNAMLNKLFFKRAVMPAIAALSLFAVPAMYADTVTTFTAGGSFSDGATLSGIVVIDVTTGAVQSGTSLSASAPLSLSAFTFDVSASSQGAEYILVTDSAPLSAFDITLDIPVTTLVGYAGGSVSGGANGGTSAALVSGSLTATPEPMSVVLVGSAMLGLLGLRRQMAK
jgi:hypothetical protein